MFADAYRGRGVSRFMCTYALTLSLFMFLSYVVLWKRVTVSIRLFFTWVLCIYIILDKGCHILYVFGLNSTVCIHIVGVRTKDRVVEKLVLRYVSTKWMAPNKCCGIFYVHWPSTAKYTEASPPARKMSLFSSIIITIILFYAIIRIYIILHIYLQVSETEGLADLHWVIGQSVLEKLIQHTSMEYLLRFQECSFKSSNLQLRIWMFLISRLQK